MRCSVALSAALVLVIGAGCGNAGSPAAAPGMQAPLAAGDRGARTNLSGQYTGTIKDNVHGKGRASADLAQSHDALGGTMTAGGDSGSQTALSAWAVDATALRGEGVLESPSVTCTLSETATYDAATHRLAGSYRAVHGCSGEHGTFRLKQQCFYARAGNDVRPEAGGLRQC